MAAAIVNERCLAPLVAYRGVALGRAVGDSVRLETAGRPLAMMLEYPALGRRNWS